MRLIIMFIAIALAAGAFFITMHFTAAPPRDTQMPVVNPQVQVKEAPSVDVYTAKQDIPIGTVIAPEMLDLQPWPKNLVTPDMVVAESPHPGDIIHMIARTPFSKGEPVMLGKLANANDPSFLAASLGEGMRLVTIAVDAVSGVGGFVFPGDRVDILLTHEVPVDTAVPQEGDVSGSANATASGQGVPKPAVAGGPADAARSTGQGVSNVMNTVAANGLNASTGTRASAAGLAARAAAPKKQATELLVPNVRVLATNQKSTAHGGDVPTVPSTVSIEVSLADAQKIRLAENGNGRMSLALRSLKEKDTLSPNAVPSVIPDLSAFKDVPDTGISQVVVVRGVHSESVEVSKP